jgi:hypothetical protein
MKDYNNNFSPKDFSPTLLRKNYKLDNIKTESYSRPSTSSLMESYSKLNNSVDISVNDDTMVMSMNGTNGFNIPYAVDELIPYIVEHSLVKGKIDTSFIRNLYTTYEKYQRLNEQSNHRELNKSENLLLKQFSTFFGSE